MSVRLNNAGNTRAILLAVRPLLYMLQRFILHNKIYMGSVYRKKKKKKPSGNEPSRIVSLDHLERILHTN